MAELESRQKGFSVGYILSTNSNTRAEMKSVAGIAPGHGGKDILKEEIINDITDLWNANCPDPKYKKVALRGLYPDQEVITDGIV